MKGPPFSDRTAWDLRDNDFACALAAAKSSGRPLVDLTESNPTRVGLGGGADLIALLGDPRGASYMPSALGNAAARSAVAAYYAERRQSLDPARVVLSASTSESYGWLFKLLCNAGDGVLVPAPSYPLFGFLAELEDVKLVTYPLRADEGWAIDLGALRDRIEPETRAIVLVHPNNPTGSLVGRDEARAVEELAAERGLALIVDEVFSDYAFAPEDPRALPSFVGERSALTFVLSGLSKVVAMPQLKLGWIGVLGPAPLVAEALGRLEVIADTFLSIGTPVQLALPAILADRAPIQARIRERVGTNLEALDRALSGGPARRLPARAGWYAIIEITRSEDEDAWVSALLREEGIVVHPGYFFDLAEPGFLVLSLLPEPEAFARAATTLAARLAR